MSGIDGLVAGVLGNPAVPGEALLRALTGELGRVACNGLAEATAFPQEVIEVMVGHPDRRVRMALAGNPHVDPVQRARLVTDPDRVVAVWTVRGGRHPDGDPRPLPDDAYARFLSHVMWSEGDPDGDLLTRDEMMQELVASPDTPSHIYRSFARRPEAELRLMACWWWESHVMVDRVALTLDPVRGVRRRARRAAFDVRRCLTDIDWSPTGRGSEFFISHRPLTRADAERIVLGDAPPHYRPYAAGNSHLPADLVAVLARDPDPRIRYRVSIRPELTEGQRAAIDYEVPALADLDDPMQLVPRCLVGTPEEWARSRHPALRRRAACSGGQGRARSDAGALADELRDALAVDPDLGVRVLTCRHQVGVAPELLLRAYRDFHGCHRNRLTYRPGFPTHGLARFAGDPDPGMRELVLRDPGASAEVVLGLLADPERCVRTALARHPAVPVDRLLVLLDDPELGPYAARNPALPVEVMHRILDAAGVPRGV
ncbi:hypothetical protein [Embleya sp. NPDC050493]|uniref:hypothetical protein n=1 Tax=Embleya sp. NPDC050493 TaxID=3363989 RepID=UPI0037B3114B